MIKIKPKRQILADRVSTYRKQQKQSKKKSRSRNANKYSQIEEKKWRKRSVEYLNTMLEAVELPAGIPDLDTGLTDVN